jgi:hypothetical protein
MTLTFWYRHIPCLDAQCEIKLFQFGWGAVYIQDNACYIEVNVEGEEEGTGDYWYFEDFGIPSKFHLKDDKIWRHIAIQFDEDAEMMRFFLDGALAMEGPSLTPVSEMDFEETKRMEVSGQPDFLLILLLLSELHFCHGARTFNATYVGSSDCIGKVKC